MNESKITVTRSATGECSMSVSGRTTADCILRCLDEINTEDVRTLDVSLTSASASDFMLVQLLALFRREGKSIQMTWTDHEPSTTILNAIEPLTK